MQRVWILLAAFVATLSFAKPPNIVYIISDDQTWTDYSLSLIHISEPTRPY